MNISPKRESPSIHLSEYTIYDLHVWSVRFLPHCEALSSLSSSYMNALTWVLMSINLHRVLLQSCVYTIAFMLRLCACSCVLTYTHTYSNIQRHTHKHSH